MAVGVASLAALTDGPLGVGKLLSRRTHMWLDRAVVLVFVAVPLVGSWPRRRLAVVLSECLAIFLGLLSHRTAYVDHPPRAPGLPTTGAGPSPGAAEALRAAGFALGRARRSAPRALGRTVGRRRSR